MESLEFQPGADIPKTTNGIVGREFDADIATEGVQGRRRHFFGEVIDAKRDARCRRVPSIARRRATMKRNARAEQISPAVRTRHTRRYNSCTTSSTSRKEGNAPRKYALSWASFGVNFLGEPAGLVDVGRHRDVLRQCESDGRCKRGVVCGVPERMVNFSDVVSAALGWELFFG